MLLKICPFFNLLLLIVNLQFCHLQFYHIKISKITDGIFQILYKYKNIIIQNKYIDL